MMRRKWLWGGLAGFGVLIVVAFLALRDQLDLARIGVAYAAKQTCSCLYVAGRTPESCATDYDPETYKLFDVAIETDASPQSVSVSAFSVFKARAIFEPGYGCTLVE